MDDAIRRRQLISLRTLLSVRWQSWEVAEDAKSFLQVSMRLRICYAPVSPFA